MNSSSFVHLWRDEKSLPNLFCTQEFAKAAGVLTLGCLALLAGSLLYLCRRTKKNHYSFWAISWLLHASGLALYLEWLQTHADSAYFAIAICLSSSALSVFAGNLKKISSKPTNSVILIVTIAVLCWAFWAVYALHELTWALTAPFMLFGLGQIWAGLMYFQFSRDQSSHGTRLVGISFVLLGLHCGAFVFFQGSFWALSLGFTLTSILAILATVGLTVETVIDRSEMAVAPSQMKYREILEAISEGVFIVDIWSMRVLYANRAARELTKREAKDLVGYKFTELCPSLQDCVDSKSDPRKSFNAIFKPYKEFYIVRADGAMLPCQGEAICAEWEDKTIMQVQVRQVTDRGRVGEFVRRTDKMTALGQMIAGIAHELNNPLAVILGRAQIIAERAKGPEREELLKIMREAERAARIVRDLLTFARPCEPQFCAVNINRLVCNVLEVLGPQLSAHKIRAENQLNPQLPLTKGDSLQIEQILTNLVNNAIYAMSAHLGERSLKVSTQENGTFIRILVANTGPRIPEEIKNRIFEPFFTTKPPGKGTGLGLSICNSIVEAHHGKLWVESSVSRDTTFFIELPVVECQPEPQELPGEPGTRTLNGALAFAGRKAMVVDDELGMREVLESILKDRGFAVEVAANGLEAIEKINRGPHYDIILSDLCMPGMDGQQLYSQICQTWPGLTTRIVFVTGDTVGVKSREFLEQVKAQWVSKPFSVNLLEEVIGNVMRQPPASIRSLGPIEEPQIQSAPNHGGTPHAAEEDAPRNRSVFDVKPRVLVVDDERGIRDVVQFSLEGCGYHVDTAADGREGLNRISSVRYDVILSDILMPGMDGGEFYDTVLRIDPELARRIVFVTADAVSVKARGILQRTNNRCISKPFSLAALEHLVQGMLCNTKSVAGSARN